MEEFVLSPGKALLHLVYLARNCRAATKLMQTANTEVMEKYEKTAQQCPLVIHALLQTLEYRQLFELFFKTKNGSELLLELVSVDMETTMYDVLASDRVYVIIDKRWTGRLWRSITRRNARDGSYAVPTNSKAPRLPSQFRCCHHRALCLAPGLEKTFHSHPCERRYLPRWKGVVLFCILIFGALPLNLILLPLCVAVPPFKKTIKRYLSEDSEGGGGGSGSSNHRGLRRHSSLTEVESIRSSEEVSGYYVKRESRYYGQNAPLVKWLKDTLSISISWQGLYLLETPAVCIVLYTAAQIAFVVLYINVELPSNDNLNPEPGLRFVLMGWAASNAWLGLEGLIADFTSWQERVTVSCRGDLRGYERLLDSIN